MSLAASLEPPGETCQSCHPSYFEAPLNHKAIPNFRCEACHTASENHLQGKTKTEVTTDSTESTCYGCHQRQDAERVVHPALKTGLTNCLRCHEPHGTLNPGFLRSSALDLCLKCHDTFQKTGKSVHRIMYQGKSCSHCHDPHASNHPLQLHEETVTLCLSCHNRPIKIQGRTIPDIKANLATATNIHASANKNCNACHDAHASPYGWLVIANYPVKDHAPYSEGDAQTPNTYALCFQCHDKNLMKENFGATKFRSDEITPSGKQVSKNLHWLHVTDAKSSTGGKMGRSCRICHEPHAAVQPHLLRSVMSHTSQPLTFQGFVNGGTCSKSCHSAPITYMRIEN